jgi:CNT family concentrative nucleoside transporter
MADIREGARSPEIQAAHANGDHHKARDEGPELVPYHTPEGDLESGEAREKKMGSPQLESYNDGDSQSRVGSVRGEEEGHKKWMSIGYIYRRFRPVFHFLFWVLFTV